MWAGGIDRTYEPCGFEAWRGGYELANRFGLYDMHGNVAEWCSDWNGLYFEGGRDPQGAKSGEIRVLRGGSWISAAVACRSAFCGGGAPDDRGGNIGFRIALQTSSGDPSSEEIKAQQR